MNQNELLTALQLILGNDERMNALEELLSERVAESRNRRIVESYWKERYAAKDKNQPEDHDKK